MSTQNIGHISVTEFRTKDKDIFASHIFNFSDDLSTSPELILVSFESWDSNESNDGTCSSGGVDGAEFCAILPVAKTHNADNVN